MPPTFFGPWPKLAGQAFSFRSGRWILMLRTRQRGKERQREEGAPEEWEPFAGHVPRRGRARLIIIRRRFLPGINVARNRELMRGADADNGKNNDDQNHDDGKPA